MPRDEYFLEGPKNQIRTLVCVDRLFVFIVEKAVLWIRILSSSSKKSKTNLVFYCL
jgi:hypothetical protein